MKVLSFLKIYRIVVVIIACALTHQVGMSAETEVLFAREGQPEASYHYIAGDRRDPFQSMLGSRQATPVKIPKPSNLDFTTANWKILGIMSGSKGTQAVLRSDQGHRYFVSPGDVVGPDGLKVVQVTRSSVRLEFLPSKTKRQPPAARQVIELTLGP